VIRLPILAALIVTLALVGPTAAERDEFPTPYAAATHLSGKIGSRPASGKDERRAHDYVARQFRAAGLEVSVSLFSVPGRKRSRNVIGRIESPASCLVILMAHTDSVPPGLGANDNASGVGVLVGLAPRLAGLDLACDVWLVATGAEERVVTGLAYHAGSAALVKTVKNAGRAGDLRIALSVDMVGRGNASTCARRRHRSAKGSRAPCSPPPAVPASPCAGPATRGRGTRTIASSSWRACRARCSSSGKEPTRVTTSDATCPGACRSRPSAGFSGSPSS
jgi:Peptidase family M28